MSRWYILAGDQKIPLDTPIIFETHPSRYRHLRLETHSDRARIILKVDENGGLRPGYQLKLNSYDLGVDIELADAVTRLRFEHPGVSTVTLTSALDGTFCAGANIFMLASSDYISSKLLQVHQRNTPGDGGREPERRPALRRRAQRDLQRWRLRTRDGM